MIEPNENISEPENVETTPSERSPAGKNVRTWRTPTVSRLNVAATEFAAGSASDSEGFTS
jgi:hypothetical protein